MGKDKQEETREKVSTDTLKLIDVLRRILRDFWHSKASGIEHDGCLGPK